MDLRAGVDRDEERRRSQQHYTFVNIYMQKVF
jgi:hypothetical protein